MQLKIAQLSDIEATLRLHAKYQIDTIKEEDKKDGFVTTAFSKEELVALGDVCRYDKRSTKSKLLRKNPKRRKFLSIWSNLYR